jgi:hypothetical protein
LYAFNGTATVRNVIINGDSTSNNAFYESYAGAGFDFDTTLTFCGGATRTSRIRFHGTLMALTYRRCW